MKTFNKEQEKKILRQLVEADTYFATSFTKETVEQMCENIDNDLPILMGTNTMTFEDNEAAIEAAREPLDKQIASLSHDLSKANMQASSDEQEIRNLKHLLDKIGVNWLMHLQAIEYDESHQFTMPQGADLYYTPERVLELKVKNGLSLSDSEKAEVLNLLKSKQ